MKEKDFNEKLDELRGMLESALDETGLREEFENFKKTNKPKFKIFMKSNPDGESCQLEIEGNKPSIQFALVHLTANLIEHTNLTAEDIREAIEKGIETVDDDEEE